QRPRAVERRVSRDRRHAGQPRLQRGAAARARSGQDRRRAFLHVAALEGLILAAPEIRPIDTPDKIPLRACVWTPDAGVTRRGVCMLLNGLTEFIEKYQEVADELNARGFVVASLDWRGQGASERTAQGNRKIH